MGLDLPGNVDGGDVALLCWCAAIIDHRLCRGRVPRTAVILLATTDETNQSPASNTTRYCSTVNGRPRCCCHLLIRMRISTTCQILSVVYHELEVPLKTAPSPGRTHGSLGQPESTNHMQRDQFSHLCRAHSCVQQTDRPCHICDNRLHLRMHCMHAMRPYKKR